MLDKITLGNFKAFADPQEIPLKPITLVFGPNSAGKSSILHGLLLAHHAATTGEVDVHRTALGGEAVDLGGFGRYVHQRDPENRVHIELDFTADELDDLLSSLMRKSRTSRPVLEALASTDVNVSLEIGRRSREKITRREAAAKNTDEAALDLPTVKMKNISDPCLMTFIVEVSGETVLRLTRGPGSEKLAAEDLPPLRLRYLNTDHPVLQKLLRERYAQTDDARLTEDDYKNAEQKARSLVGFFENEFFPLDEWYPAQDDASSLDDAVQEWDAYERWEAAFSWSEPSQSVHPTESFSRERDLAFFFIYFTRHLIKEAGRIAKGKLEQVQYLGPLRSYPSRHPGTEEKKDADWYAGGGYAWERLREDKRVRSVVNQWLSSEHVKTPYRLRVRRLASDLEVTGPLSDRIVKVLEDTLGTVLTRYMDGAARFQSLSAFVEEVGSALGKEVSPALRDAVSSAVDADDVAQQWVESIFASSAGDLRNLILVDERTGTQVSHRDVGFGISQLLPVLTYPHAFEEKLIAMEQPEIHLHPALQAELGDVFIQSALGERGNRFILETHSEHLILRILRRIRETTMQRNDAIPEVTPDDVSLLYVGPEAEGSRVKPIRIDKRGQLIDAVPGGFFEEDFEEIF